LIPASCFIAIEGVADGACREAKGAFYEHSSMEALLGNVSEVKLQQAAQQTEELLATVLAGDASK
jgi:hypothetical protein